MKITLALLLVALYSCCEKPNSSTMVTAADMKSAIPPPALDPSNGLLREQKSRFEIEKGYAFWSNEYKAVMRCQASTSRFKNCTLLNGATLDDIANLKR